MYRIALLGVENSHADTFLRFMREENEFSDLAPVGVYSNEAAAAARIHEKYGVPLLGAPEEAVGAVDGVIVTARHGGNHLPYAAPYLPAGIPVFLDKPVTVTEADAHALAEALRRYKNPFTGGSCLKYSPFVQSLRAAHESGEGGRTLGGVVRCPVAMNSEYGGFYFYAQHLVETVVEIYGTDVRAAAAFRCDAGVTAVFRYPGFDVTGCFMDGNYQYAAWRFAEKTSEGGVFPVDTPCFLAELRAFHALLHGEAGRESISRLLCPVFVMNAIERSLTSGREETVGGCET